MAIQSFLAHLKENHQDLKRLSHTFYNSRNWVSTNGRARQMGLWTTRLLFVSNINLVLCVQCLPAVDPQAKKWGLCLQINHSDVSIWVLHGFPGSRSEAQRMVLGSVPRVPAQSPPGEGWDTSPGRRGGSSPWGLRDAGIPLLVLIPGCPDPGPEQEIEN